MAIHAAVFGTWAVGQHLQHVGGGRWTDGTDVVGERGIARSGLVVEDRHVEFAVFAVLGVLVGYAVAGLVVDSTHG